VEVKLMRNSNDAGPALYFSAVAARSSSSPLGRHTARAAS
jgi:hypothetical protein